MPPLVTILTVALLGATTLTALSEPRALEDHALDLRVARTLPDLADDLRGESGPLRAAFVDFSGNEELVLNARLALLRHPLLARQIIPMYANSAAFRLVLRRHGPAAIPPIHYFVTHEPATLRLHARVVAWLSQWDGEPGTRPNILSPHERGTYAIEFIRREGHDFLGQFVTTDAGEVAWIQSERFATEAKRFLTSGIVELETRRLLGEEVYPGDYGWAAVDILLPFAAFKVARAGKAAVTGRAAAATTRAAGATRLAGAGAHAGRLARFGRTAARAGVVAGAAYVVMHPGVIGSIGSELAGWTGLPEWLVTGVLWFLLLLPLLIVLGLVHRWLLRPAWGAVGTLARITMSRDRQAVAAGPAQAVPRR